jgi:translocation and assembly module TamA
MGGLGTWTEVQAQTSQTAQTSKNISVQSATLKATLPDAAAFTLEIHAPPEIADWLKQHLTLGQFSQLSDLTDSEMQRLQEDALSQATQLLATRGYFNAQPAWAVPTVLPEHSSSSSTRHIVLMVEPGAQAHVARVNLVLNGDLAQRADRQNLAQMLKDQWLLSAGQAFTQSAWSAAKTQAVNQLAEQWYPLAQVTQSEALVDADTDSVSLSVTLDSGPSVRLGAIQVTGADRYGPLQVRRLAQLEEGQPYRRIDLLQAQQRLVASGFYDSVFVNLDADAVSVERPVKIELREAPKQKWVVGLGYRSSAGTRFTVEHTHNILPWSHWRSVTKLSLDPNLQSMGLDLIGPPNEDAWRWSTAAKIDHQNFIGYAVSSQQWRAGRLQRGDVIDRNLYMQYDMSHAQGTQQGIRESISGNLAWTWRRFEGLPFPSEGLGFVAEIGPGVTLGDQRQPFVRSVARTLLVQPLGAGSGRLSLRSELGGVFAPTVSGVPTTQLFTAGGDNSVRGYPLNSLGVIQSSGAVAPGRYLASGSVEWQRPIDVNRRRTEWESVLFVDAAAVGDTAQTLKAHVGAGVGARWRSPLGPLQIDLAQAQDTHRWRLHLSVGFVFR